MSKHPLWVLGSAVVPSPGSFHSTIEPLPGLVIQIVADSVEKHDLAQLELREAVNALRET